MTKKKELSPELKAECEAAKSLFVSKKNALGLTQASLAEAADISAAAVAMYLNGTNPLNAKFATVLSRLLGVPVERFSRRLADEIAGLTSADQQDGSLSASEMVRQMLARQGRGLSDEARFRLLSAAEDSDKNEAEIDSVITAALPRTSQIGDEVWIAHYDIRGAMGGGQNAHDYPEVLKDVRVSPKHLRELGLDFQEYYHLKVVTGWGQSMEPTIKHRDPLIVDVSVREFAGDGIYLFSWDEHLYIKRLQVADQDHFEMISDNSKHKDRMIRRDMTFIQARVLLVWNAHLV
ncbi:S24 family peptidase [Pseudomonas grimontii]|uniref:S24 family peptidase n=1 Tax=Pseudomonas grimontii TaxID=129847 RepID=UPI002168C7A5|nr:S24 family peptidase [Pseudomonas grimontii]MCS3512551.1 phage repressor protein C with HTH and peptisase S24 domain/predicted transcriptional regulator [Pseudomonas grimontii]